MNEEQFRELSAARALHALSPEEEQAFSQALLAHPEWQTVFDEDSETASALSEVAVEVIPPTSARVAILDLISRTPQFDADEHTPTPGFLAEGSDPEAAQAPSAPKAKAGRARPMAKWFTLAASVAVLLTAALVFPWSDTLAPKDPITIALQQVETAADARSATAELPDGSTATLHWSVEANQAVFETVGMKSAPHDHDYELWIVRGDTPISIGVMKVGSDGDAAMLARGFTPGDVMAITVEDEGGSATGKPTSDPILVLASA